MTQKIWLEEVDIKDWPDLARKFCDFTFEQDLDYVLAGARRVGATPRAFAVWRDTHLLGAACLRVKTVPVLGAGIAYLSAGPLVGHGAVEDAHVRVTVVLDALKQQLVVEEGHLFRFRLSATTQGVSEADILRMGGEPTERSHSYRTVLVDLCPDAEAIRKGLHSKWRYELRRAEKEALQIDTGRDGDLVERFLKLYGEMREFKTFREGLDPVILREMEESALDFEIRIAHREGADIGGHVTVLTPSCATYLFGATTKEGRDLRAGYALAWEAMTASRARGIRWFDMGGIDKTTNAAGYTFKIRTGGRETSALGPYEAMSGLRGPLLRGIESIYGRLRRRQ